VGDGVGKGMSDGVGGGAIAFPKEFLDLSFSFPKEFAWRAVASDTSCLFGNDLIG
jgi:hypothetical protein